jgi:hypothetical protein
MDHVILAVYSSVVLQAGVPPTPPTTPAPDADPETTEPAPTEPAPPAPSPPPPPPAPPPAPATATPYGMLITNFFFNTEPVQNNDVPLSALPDGDAAFGATARQSRLGLNVKAPAAATAIGAASVDATVELDFFGGQYPTSGNSYYMQLLPRLRLFFAAMSWKRLKVVVGQDWALLAPVNPDSLNHMVLPAMSNTGNLWNRLPQLKLEAKAGPLTIAVAALAPTDATATGTAALSPIRDPGPAEKSLLPSLEARIAAEVPIGKAGKITIGASGHFGREKLADDPMTPPPLDEAQTLASYAGAADVSIAIGTLIAIKAEGYLGANLDGFFSNAALNGAPGDRRATRVRGGWAQLSIKPGKLGLHATAGMEDPDADDGQQLAGTNPIRLNWAIYGALTYALGPKLNVGVEFDHLHTNRQGVADDAAANHINATLQLGF